VSTDFPIQWALEAHSVGIRWPEHKTSLLFYVIWGENDLDKHSCAREVQTGPGDHSLTYSMGTGVVAQR